MIKQIFYLVQPSPVRYTLKTRGSQRLKACWKRWVFRPHQNRALDVVGKCKCSGRLFQMTRATMWKLRLRSSVAVLSTARSPHPAEQRLACRHAGSMQDRHLGHRWTWKLQPWIVFAEALVASAVMYSYLPPPATTRAVAFITICSRQMTCAVAPYWTELQQSTQFAMNVVVSVCRESKVSDHWMMRS